jgi:uncharacterized repeat protein (TIGR03809 family)
MSDTIPHRMSSEITRKWHDLAEKRRTHFVDLYESGRWKHYYSESEFISLMRQAVQLADDWSRLASPRQAAE